MKKVLLCAVLFFLITGLNSCSGISGLQSLSEQNKRFKDLLVWNDLQALQGFFSEDHQLELMQSMGDFFQNNKVIDASTLKLDKHDEKNSARILLTVQWHPLSEVDIQQNIWLTQWTYHSKRKNWFLDSVKKQ